MCLMIGERLKNFNEYFSRGCGIWLQTPAFKFLRLGLLSFIKYRLNIECARLGVLVV
jgi:hypothetical protein